MGFEPTHPKIADLKSAPLDLSGIQANADFILDNQNLFLELLLEIFIRSVQGSNLRPIG